MSKQPPQTEGMPGMPSLMPFPWMANLGGSAALNNLTRAGETCQKACLAWQQEIARFTTARLQRDGELAQKLLTSPNWSEALRLQQAWLTAAGQDYFDEANRLVQLAQKAGADAMRPAATSTSQAAE